MFKRLFVSFLLAITALTAQIPATPTERVTDKTGTLSQAARTRMSDMLMALEKKNGSQVIVYMDYTLNGVPIEDFGIKAARAWHPGQAKNNNGCILFIFKNDRKMRIEVGRGLEGSLTDTTTKAIMDNVIRPKLKAGDWDGGVTGGIEAIVKVASGGPFQSVDPNYTRNTLIMYAVIAFVILTIIVLIASGGDIFLPWIIFCIVTGGDSGDGFSGGGGSFDGGGSSSDW